MPIKTLTGESSFSVPANASGVSATVNGAGATLSLVSPGQYNITSPTVNPTDPVLVTYTDTVVGRQIRQIAGLTSRTADINNVETTALAAFFPAGTLRVGDRIRVFLSYSKNGTTDVGTIAFRFGPLGTTGDPSLLTLSPLTAASRSAGLIFEFKVISLTQMQRLGNQTAGVSAYTAAGTVAMSAPVTVADVSANNMWFDVNIYSSGTTNTVVLEDGTVQHIPNP